MNFLGMAEKSRVVQKTSVAPEKKRPFSQVKNFMKMFLSG